jgi:transcriptional regulator with XRE-family HTH domain
MLASYPTESSIDGIKRRQILRSLENREYRREFAADVGTGLAFQVRLLREARGWTQEELAHQMGKRQETICQWENPDYGRYTLKTLSELAAAFDVALLVRFAPFSELVDWSVNLTPERLAPASFDDELQCTLPRMVLPQDSTTDSIPSRHVARQEFMMPLAVEPTAASGESALERQPPAEEKEKERQYAQVA